MNWATQIAARFANTASSVFPFAAAPVTQPPQPKPTTIAATAPSTTPQAPNLIFTDVSCFMEGTSNIAVSSLVGDSDSTGPTDGRFGPSTSSALRARRSVHHRT